jgi:hypothetical protein
VWETIYLLQTTCVGSLVELVNLYLFETILFVSLQVWVLFIANLGTTYNLGAISNLSTTYNMSTTYNLGAICNLGTIYV